MASFTKKIPSFSFSRESTTNERNDSDDSNGDNSRGRATEKRQSRSLFSSLTPLTSSSSSIEGSRPTSPYAGRLRYRQSRKGKSTSNSEQKDNNPRSSRNKAYTTSDTETENTGANSSAYDSEAESDSGDGALSRIVSNSPSVAGTSSDEPHIHVPNLTTAAGAQGSLSKIAAVQPPQAREGAPRNAFHESGDEAGASEQFNTSTSTGTDSAPTTSATITTDKATARGTSGPVLVTFSSSGPTSRTQSIQHAEYALDSGEDEEYDDDDDFDLDPTVAANTEANSGSLTAAELLNAKPALLAGYSYTGDGEDGDEDIDAQDAFVYDDNEEPHDWPNLVRSPASPFASMSGSAGSPAFSRPGGKGTGGNSLSPGAISPAATSSRNMHPEMPLVASRPIYERNRCTITLTHGDPDAHVVERANIAPLDPNTVKEAKSSTLSASLQDPSVSRLTGKPTRKKRKGKTYVVASDLSEESYYAIEWAIGTVLRSGDELLFVTVMETDTKLDPEDGAPVDKSVKIRAQQERQTRAMQLSREATALLERTRLHVRVVCQAIHAKNARHMIIDLIDYFSPTLVIIGSRGLSRLKGIILGSVSHYLIQKSSAPVMVTRRRLKPLRRPPRPIGDLQRKPRVNSLANATIDVESHAGAVPPSHASQVTKDGDGQLESQEGEASELQRLEESSKPV